MVGCLYLLCIICDDGLNAAGGADQSGFGGRGPDSFGGSSDCCITISGGTIRIDASGDGIDSNGDLTVSGGEIYGEELDDETIEALKQIPSIYRVRVIK